MGWIMVLFAIAVGGLLAGIITAATPKIIKEIILSPTFPDEEIQKRKQRWIAEIDQAKESPRSVNGSYFNKQIFQK